MRSLGALLSSLAVLLVAATAGAAPVSSVEMRVETNGYYTGHYDETQIGCSPGGGSTFNCQGSNFTVGNLRLDSWNMNFDADPLVSGITAVTNIGITTQQFTLTFTLPVVPVLPSSLTGGSIQGGVTDNTFDGATLSTVLGSSFYTALIDAVSYQTLYPHASSVSTPPLGSNNLAQTSFGLIGVPPFVNQPGPAANVSIGIRLDFTLTPGDSASFTSNFVVIPVPEPGTALLLAFGLGALALRRHR